MNDRFRHTLSSQVQSTDLLEQYQPGATFFSSPRGTLLAHGVKAVLPSCDGHRLAATAAANLKNAERDGEPNLILMGAVPFQLDGGSAQPRLFMPEQLLIGAGSDAGVINQVESPTGLRLATMPRMQPRPAAYCNNVRRALARIRDAEFGKAVLSRSLILDAHIDIQPLLQRLAARNVHGYTFAVDLVDGISDQMPERRTLIGASPELLLAKHGRQVTSHPLAGSIPRSANTAEDGHRADGLLRSIKDRHEHALVVDAVAAALRPFCRTLHVPAEPSLLATATMWHLGTEIRGELLDPATTSLELALTLHPTPAVCGYPLAPARKFIADVEGFDRRFFAGLVGWCDSSGDGEWAVTLRCAEVGANKATLYAGAGIVAGSEPELELLETSAKLRTMLAAMNLESVLEDTVEDLA